MWLLTSSAFEHGHVRLEPSLVQVILDARVVVGEVAVPDDKLGGHGDLGVGPRRRQLPVPVHVAVVVDGAREPRPLERRREGVHVSHGGSGVVGLCRRLLWTRRLDGETVAQDVPHEVPRVGWGELLLRDPWLLQRNWRRRPCKKTELEQDLIISS
jgi:hypothetical protein